MTDRVKEKEDKVTKEYKAFTVTIEPLVIKGKKKLYMGMRVLNDKTDKYALFESEVPKTSPIGKEIARLHKEALAELKKVNKKNNE